MNIENNNRKIESYNKMNNVDLSSQFVELEKEYLNFKRNIEKSDFANSPQRYLLQRGYEKSLLAMVVESSNQNKIEEYTKLLEKLQQN